MAIDFIENIPTNASNWEAIRKWIDSCVANEGFQTGELSFVFMSDDDLLKYNRDFLQHDYYTDVITFDDSENTTINGDILVSVDRIIDNHKSLKISYKEEFLRVCVHGVLHLCGYKDKAELDIKEMRRKEAEYLIKVDFEI